MEGVVSGLRVCGWITGAELGYDGCCPIHIRRVGAQHLAKDRDYYYYRREAFITTNERPLLLPTRALYYYQREASVTTNESPLLWHGDYLLPTRGFYYIMVINTNERPLLLHTDHN